MSAALPSCFPQMMINPFAEHSDAARPAFSSFIRKSSSSYEKALQTLVARQSPVCICSLQEV